MWLIYFTELMAPNPKCIVCSEKPQVVVKIDTSRVTVKQFRDEVLIKALNMLEPDVITEGKGLVLISSEEGETDCNNDKKLSDLEVVDGCILKVDDFVQQYELTVIISHKEADRDGDLYEVIADPDSLKPETGVDEQAEATAAASSPKESDNGEPKAKKARHEEPQPEDSDDDLCIIEDGENDSNRPTTSATSSSSTPAPSSASSSSILGKHKSDHQNNQAANNSSSADADKMDVENAPSTSSEPRTKRPRAEQNDDEDLIIIDDD